MKSIDVNAALAMYNTGQYPIYEIAKTFRVSAGKMYYALRDAGCIFSRKRRKPYTHDEWLHRSAAQKGKIISEAQRKKMSEQRSCKYNGLNGYGHTKEHSRGYILVYVPLHPKAHKDGYVMLHTIIMERFIGRYLAPNEVVHHINHDRKDNRIENLVLMDKKEHMKMHMKERHEKRRNDLLTA